MLRIYTLTITIALSVASTAFPQADRLAGQAPKNLVRHPSLEGTVAENGLPEGWRGTYFKPDNSYQVRVTDTGRTGSKSLLIEGDGDFGVVSTNFVRIEPKTRYRARGWVRIEGDAQAAADVKFHYFDAENRYLGQTRIPFVSPPTKDWTLIEVTDRAEDFPKAVSIQLAVALAGKGKAWFDDLELTAHPADRLPADFDVAPELKPLARYVGDWKVDVVCQPAVFTPDGLRKTEFKTCRWILRNKFVEEIKRDAEPSQNEHRVLFGYDRRAKVLRNWYFASDGNVFTSNGSWDEKAATMTWESDVGTAQATGTHRFLDADTFEQNLVIKDENGRVLLDAKAVHRRVAAEK